MKDSQTTSYIFTNFIIVFLIAIGIVLIAIDVTYMTDWVYGFRLADFYTYLAFMGIISAWSVFGLVCGLKKSMKGISIYVKGLTVLAITQLIVGCVHIVILFSTYGPSLMDSCLQRNSSRYFWWSLGYEETSEMKEIYMKCLSLWKSFSIERLVSWVAYSVISFVCLYFITRYQRKLSLGYKLAQGEMLEDQKSDWSSDHHSDTKDAETGVVTYHNEEFPDAEKETDEGKTLTANMHQQRQRLYEEITKRKKAKKNINRKSIGQNPNRNSILVVHPLDLSRDPECYEPPPMPSPPKDEEQEEDGKATWNRYDMTIDKDEMDIEREKKLKRLSAERMEYEMYRSNDSGQSTEKTKAKGNKKRKSNRKRPQSGRWPDLYPDEINRLAAIQQSESPEIEENDEEKQRLIED